MADGTNTGAAAERVQRVNEEIRQRVKGNTSHEGWSDYAAIERSIAEVRKRATVTAHWGIAPTFPVVGRLEVLAKRAMRIGLRWYINPIVEQQNECNLAIIAALYEIQAQLDAKTRNFQSDPDTDLDREGH